MFLLLKQPDCPYRLAPSHVSLNVEKIPGNLPLLISINSLSAANISIFFGAGYLTMGKTNEKIAFARTSTNHIVLDLLPRKYEHNISLISIHEIDYNSVVKLHKQFGHCSASKLYELSKNAGCKDSTVLEKIHDVC